MPKPPRQIAEAPLPKGTAALFSCNSEQKSFEDPVLRHGIFFYQVIRAWKGEADSDRDHDRRITLDELERFVRRETKTHARDALSEVQTPVFRGDPQAAQGWVVASLGGAGRADVGDLINRGEALLRQVKVDEAESEFANALRADPNSAKAHFGMAKIHHAKGRLAEALQEYSKAIQADPSDALALVGRATAYGAKDDLKAALDDYEQAIRINRDLAIAYVGQGAILTRLNRLAEAIAACTQAIKLDTRNAKAYYNRALAREATQDKEGAAQDFRTAIQLDPRLNTR
jgi:tetratricopeptide (TPR) repeat protein